MRGYILVVYLLKCDRIDREGFLRNNGIVISSPPPPSHPLNSAANRPIWQPVEVVVAGDMLLTCHHVESNSSGVTVSELGGV